MHCAHPFDELRLVNVGGDFFDNLERDIGNESDGNTASGLNGGPKTLNSLSEHIGS